MKDYKETQKKILIKKNKHKINKITNASGNGRTRAKIL